MPFMRLSDEEKMWLREQCIEPIIHSAIERIDFYDNFTAIANNESIVIEAAFYFVINKFATCGIDELFLLDVEYGYEAFLNDLLNAIEIHEELDTDSLREWNSLIVKIQHHCFREMQALQIAKLEYSDLSNEELEEKIISIINEDFIPPWEIEKVEQKMNCIDILLKKKSLMKTAEDCKRL